MKSNIYVLELLTLVLLLRIRVTFGDKTYKSWNGYPDYVPIFDVRKDTFKNDYVSRGRMSLLGYKVETSKKIGGGKVPYNKLKELLQCSPYDEPDLQTYTSLLKLLPPTKKSLELLCAWSESEVGYIKGNQMCTSWSHCDKLRLSYLRNKNYPKKLRQKNLHGYSIFRLIRIMNGSLHLDWPWGIERINEKEYFEENESQKFSLMYLILSVVSDIGDNVFFLGWEVPVLPYNFPFPLFSYSPGIDNMDVPLPWPKSVKNEGKRYVNAELNNNFTDNFYSYNNKPTPWELRIPKAAFFSTYTKVRHIIYDQAILRPDLFDAPFKKLLQKPVESWSPLATVKYVEDYSQNNTHQVNATPTGDAFFIMPLCKGIDSIPYNPTSYKYVIVMGGHNGLATADRLAQLLAHSGAVVLLQRTNFRYHFSMRLKPWIHYVPLEYNGADAIEKIEWLKKHDRLAKRIAQNAHNFGKSYLRYEDYVCYVAAALKTIEGIVNQTDAIIPWDHTHQPNSDSINIHLVIISLVTIMIIIVILGMIHFRRMQNKTTKESTSKKT